MVQNRFTSSLLATALLTTAAFAPPSSSFAQGGRSVDTSGKTYEPLDPPANSSLSHPGRDMFEEMEQFQREMDEFISRRFENFGTMPPMPRMPARPGFGRLNAPGWAGTSPQMFGQSLNVRDEKDRYVVDLNLPGQNLPEVEVKVEGRLLRVSATHKEQSEQTGPGMQSRRQMSSHFQQAVTLPGPVKADAVRVERDQGRIQIIVPKA